MLQVGNSVRIADDILKRRKIKPRSVLGRARGKVVSLKSPFGDNWVEVKWNSKLLTHRYSSVHQIQVVNS